MKKILFYLLPALLATAAVGQDANTSIADSTAAMPSPRELQRVNNTMDASPLRAKVLKPGIITLEGVDQNMSRGEQPGLKLYIPEVTPVNFVRDFEKAVKKRTKEKSKTEGDEFIISGTQLKAISDSPLNVYSIIAEQDSGTVATVFLEDDSTFISHAQNAEKYEKAKVLLYDIGVDAYKKVVSDKLDEEKKKLRDMENDFGKLTRANEKAHANIKENEARILNTESDIEANLREQKAKDEQILNQKTHVASLGTKEEKKSAQSDLKELNKEKDRLRKDNVSMHRDIVKYRSNIEELEREIEKNLQEQALVKEQIQEQTSYVWGLEGKLEGIK